MSLRRTSFLAAVVLATAALTAVPAAEAVPQLVLKFNNGKLTLKLQGGNDQLLVVKSGNKVKVKLNGLYMSIVPRPTMSNLESIVINGRGGNDVLSVSASIKAPATIDGSGGDDRLIGGKGDDDLDGGAGTDTLIGNRGDDTLRQSKGGDEYDGGKGSDTYVLDADENAGTARLIEQPGRSSDHISFADTTGIGVDLDLESQQTQVVSSRLSVRLSGRQAFENVTGGSQPDELTGNNRVNVFTGGPGPDEFRHHGSGDGIDIIGDMTVAAGDHVRFVAGGALSAADMTLTDAAYVLRDAATGTFGFDFFSVKGSSSSTLFGTTDQSPGGRLVTDTTTGPTVTNVPPGDALIVVYQLNGGTLSGGTGTYRDRLVDDSTHGNTLLGRNGDDVVDGGRGADDLDGDRGTVAGNDELTGGALGDTFHFGESATNTLIAFGDDVVTDMSNADDVALFPGLSVQSGYNSPTVTIWNGATVYGTITAGNGRNWEAGDFL